MELPKDRKNFACMDCKKDTWDEYYMLYMRIWKRANPKIKGKLCIDCVEARLGRKLTAKDFTKKPINTLDFKRSAKLKSRLNISYKL